jgi:hypothetical protein
LLLPLDRYGLHSLLRRQTRKDAQVLSVCRVLEHEIRSEALFSDDAVLHHVDKVVRDDLGEVVRDDDGCSVPPPGFEVFEYLDSRGRVKR